MPLAYGVVREIAKILGDGHVRHAGISGLFGQGTDGLANMFEYHSSSFSYAKLRLVIKRIVGQTMPPNPQHLHVIATH